MACWWWWWGVVQREGPGSEAGPAGGRHWSRRGQGPSPRLPRPPGCSCLWSRYGRMTHPSFDPVVQAEYSSSGGMESPFFPLSIWGSREPCCIWGSPGGRAGLRMSALVLPLLRNSFKQDCSCPHHDTRWGND